MCIALHLLTPVSYTHLDVYKRQYVKNVYMHTSATPATGNPNPASGLILVKLTDNYNRLLFSNIGDASPVSGTPIACLLYTSLSSPPYSS